MMIQKDRVVKGTTRFVQKVRVLHMQLHFLLLKFHENWPKVKSGLESFQIKSDLLKYI